MKNTKMISLIAGIGLVAGPLSVMASEFGGGWTRDKYSGTLANSNAPAVEQQQAVPSRAIYRNSFGGGWAHDPITGTLYNSNAPTVEKQHSASSMAKSENHRAGSDWAKNYMFSDS